MKAYQKSPAAANAAPKPHAITLSLLHGINPRVAGQYTAEAREVLKAIAEAINDPAHPANEFEWINRKRRDEGKAEITEKERLPSFCPAVFSDGYRNDRSVGEHSAVVLDVDRAADTEALVKRCEQYACLMYESPSSTDDAPRLRIIAALEHPVPSHAVKAARSAFARELGLDPRTSGVSGADAASQIFFYGRLDGTRERGHMLFDGKPWTFDASAVPAPAAAPEASNAHSEPTRPQYKADRLPDLSSLVPHIEPAAGEVMRRGGRLISQALGGYLAREGYHPDAIEEAVYALPSDRPDERAKQARETAEQLYSGDTKAAGFTALLEHFGADVMAEVQKAVMDPGIKAWLSRSPAPFAQRWRQENGVAEPIRKANAGDRLPCVSWNELMAPLPPVTWICERLGLAAGGRPNLLTAPAGAGKTLSAQALALAVASGGKLFGEFECMRGSVLHIDVDQGQASTQHRYQMLARGLGIRGAIDLQCSFFSVSLTKGAQIDRSAADRLLNTAQSKTLVIVDSLRGLAPGIDENSSEFGEVLGELAAISNATGVTWLVIHHSGKSVGTQVRGSSAIRDRAGCIWSLSQSGGSLLWQQDKISEMSIDPARDLATTLTSSPRGGGSYTISVAPEEPGRGTGRPSTCERRRVVSIVAGSNGGMSGREIKMALGAEFGRNRCDDIVTVMTADGELMRDGKGPASRLYVSEQGRKLSNAS